MRILLTRPEADARRSAERLTALGHEAVLAPLFEIVTTGAEKPAGRFDRLLATSAHAFERLPADADALKGRPLHVVGERTARAAQAHGFTQIATVAPDAQALALEIARDLSAPAAFLYFAGRERRPELEAALLALGHSATPWIVYATREAGNAAAALADAFAGAPINAVLHFSPRSAALYLALADRAGLREKALAPAQIAISLRTAEHLQDAKDVRTASSPDLSGLLACL